jgi:hypothetical protein
VFTVSYEGTLIIKIMSITWYINIQVTSSSKTRSHVDIQVRSNVVLGYMHIVRINVYAFDIDGQILKL